MKLVHAAVLAALSFIAVTAQAKGTAKPKDEGPLFDQAAAATALRSIDLVKCKIAGGPRGEGHVVVTFAAEGTTSDVTVDGGPYVKSPVERCIVSQFKVAKIPAFKGDPVKVGKKFRID
jgi:hypothetical protein